MSANQSTTPAGSPFHSGSSGGDHKSTARCSTEESFPEYDFPKLGNLENTHNIVQLLEFMTKLYNKDDYILDLAMAYYTDKFGLESETKYGAANANEKFQQMCDYCSHQHRCVSDCGYHLLADKTRLKPRFFGKFIAKGKRIGTPDGIYCSFCKATIPADAIVKHLALKDYKSISKMAHVSTELEVGRGDSAMWFEAGCCAVLFHTMTLLFMFPLSDFLRDVVMVLYFFLSDDDARDITSPCVSGLQLAAIRNLLQSTTAITPSIASKIVIPSLLRRAHWRRGAKLVVESSLSNDTIGSEQIYDQLIPTLIKSDLTKSQVFAREIAIYKPETFEKAEVRAADIKEVFLCFYVREQCAAEFQEFFNAGTKSHGCYSSVVLKQMKTKLNYMINYCFQEASYVDVVKTLNDVEQIEDEEEYHDGCIATVDFFLELKFTDGWRLWTKGSTGICVPTPFHVEVITAERIIAVNVGLLSVDTREAAVVSLSTKAYKALDDSRMLQYLTRCSISVTRHTRRVAPVVNMHNATFLTILSRLSTVDKSNLTVSFLTGDRRLTIAPEKAAIFKDWLNTIEDESMRSILLFLFQPF